MNVLIVEPDQSTRRTLSLILEESGHSIHAVDSVDEAVPFLNGFWPDAILSNYYLGDTTAVQFCDEIRELFGEIPAVVLHSPSREHRFSVVRIPEASFMNSPFSPEELQDRLGSTRNETWEAAVG
jgi:DNA-binding response OmpR family regulator